MCSGVLVDWTRNCFKNIMDWQVTLISQFCIANQYVPKARKTNDAQHFGFIYAFMFICVCIHVNAFDLVIFHIIPLAILYRTVAWPGNIVWSHPGTCIADLTSKVPRVGNRKGSQVTYDMNWVRWSHFYRPRFSMRSSFFLETWRWSRTLHKHVFRLSKILMSAPQSHEHNTIVWLTFLHFLSKFVFVCRCVVFLVNGLYIEGSKPIFRTWTLWDQRLKKGNCNQFFWIIQTWFWLVKNQHCIMNCCWVSTKNILVPKNK